MNTFCSKCDNDVAVVSHKSWCPDYRPTRFYQQEQPDRKEQKMEIVDFYPRTFHQIPPQDNPAFGQDACLMIVAENDSLHARATVLAIDPKDDDDTVTSIAVFWKHDRAVKFCESCF